MRFRTTDFRRRNRHFGYLPEKPVVAILVGDKGGWRRPGAFQTLFPVKRYSFRARLSRLSVEW